MVEKLYKNIYRIGVALPGNPLKELNAYFLRGDDSDLLIDTGFRRPVCQEALQAGLDELGSDPARRDVLITHLHSDHSGMADLFAGPDRQIYMSRLDMEYFLMLQRQSKPDTRHKRLVREGFPEELLEQSHKTNPAETERLPGLDERFVPLEDLDTIRVGEYTLQILLVPGHTPGNVMVYIPKEQIMFTGDHVLFDITPNITYWPFMEDSLGSYLTQLRRVREIPVRLALPGHRKTGDYVERIDQLLAHHDRRLAEALSIIRDNPGLCAYDIAGRMKWKIRAANWDEFPVIQKWFAVGECFSHLDYHLLRGAIRAEEGDDGLVHYYAV